MYASEARNVLSSNLLQELEVKLFEETHKNERYMERHKRLRKDCQVIEVLDVHNYSHVIM